MMHLKHMSILNISLLCCFQYNYEGKPLYLFSHINSNYNIYCGTQQELRCQSKVMLLVVIHPACYSPQSPPFTRQLPVDRTRISQALWHWYYS